MNVNDRLALELGRALLRAVAAEERVAHLEANVREQESSGDGDAAVTPKPKP